MSEFHITIRSFRQVQALVKLTMTQPFDVIVGNERQKIDGKDLMGMCSLDYEQLVQVQARCEGEQFDCFRQAVERIVFENMAVE